MYVPALVEMYEVLHIFNVWFRERTGELKVLELVPFAQRVPL